MWTQSDICRDRERLTLWEKYREMQRHSHTLTKGCEVRHIHRDRERPIHWEQDTETKIHVHGKTISVSVSLSLTHTTCTHTERKGKNRRWTRYRETDLKKESSTHRDTQIRRHSCTQKHRYWDTCKYRCANRNWGRETKNRANTEIQSTGQEQKSCL